MPKVSVIIPCYNQGKYVDEAVDSVLAQTFQDFEIIIVNDGSTDEFTNEKLKNYDKPKTHVIHTTNEGLSAARNNGIKASRGEYILPLDADDKIQASFIEQALFNIENNLNIGAVSTNWIIFGEKDALDTSFANVVSNTKFKGGTVIDYLMSNNSMSCGLFSRKIWNEAGGYNESMKNGFEDWDFWISITERDYQIFVIEEPLYFYRVKAESMNIIADEMRPELVKQLILNHIETFQKYIVDAIHTREIVIKSQSKQISNLNTEIVTLKDSIRIYKESIIYKIRKILHKSFLRLLKF
jgi:glycosyltransferase involved in cell wall biosynthesis